MEPNEFEEIDTTEDEFDAMLAVSEPVAVDPIPRFLPAAGSLVATYYTVTVRNLCAATASHGHHPGLALRVVNNSQVLCST
jgi:hypothetical protein